jgi:hypothetical protein
MSTLPPPAFLRLKLRTTDDELGQLLSWRGRVGGRVPLYTTLVLHYDDDVAALRVGAPIVLDMAGIKRQYGVLSVEPAPDATEVSLEVRRLEQPAPEAAEPDLADMGSFYHSAEFEATGQLAADIAQLADWLAMRAQTREVAQGGLARLSAN